MKKILLSLMLLWTVSVQADTTTIYITSVSQPFQSLTISGCDTLELVNQSNYSFVLGPDTAEYGNVDYTSSYWPDSLSNTLFSGSSYFYALEDYTHLYVAHQVNPFFYSITITACPMEAVSICAGESYDFEGTPLTTSGIYSAHVSAGNGSDSTILIDLTVLPLQAIDKYETICAGTSYLFNNAAYDTSGTYAFHFQATAGCDSTVTLHLTVLPVPASVLEITGCASDTYVFNGTACDSSGTYVFHLQSAQGCDSTVTVHLTILAAPDVSVLQTDDHTLLAQAEGSDIAYSWIDCNNGMQPTGITTAGFTVSEKGDYAVIVSQNGCGDTSACHVIGTLGLSTHVPADDLSVYPLPAGDKLFIDSPIPGNYALCDGSGQVLQNGILEAGTTQLSTEGLAPGLYYLRSGNGSAIKVVKL